VKKLRYFEELEIGVEVFLPGKKHAEEPLEIGEHGVLAIPTGLNPAGFHLVLTRPKEARIVIVLRNIRQDQGVYHRHCLAQLDNPSGDYITEVMYDPIQVMRVGQNIWTSWHSEKPNRADCWREERDGRCDLFQVGIVTHDDGLTFRLLSRWGWRGQLFQALKQGVVGKPDDPKLGSFDARRPILDDPGFKKLLEGTTLRPWTGKPEELDPPLDSVPGLGYARMQWYSPFAGQTGQGPAVLYDGSAAWVHGVDILDSPDPDGIKRLYRNDLVSYAGIHTNWGTKKDGPPKLLCVKRVR